MTTLDLPIRKLAMAACLCGTALASSASTINVGASNPGWIAGYHDYSGPAFHYTCPVNDCISISSNGRADGQFVQNGSAEQFNGSWWAYLEFELPSDAGQAAMDLVIHGVDDRGTLLLNDRELSTNYIDGTFDVIIHLDDPSYFYFGEINKLSLQVINNPFNSMGDPLPFQFFDDATAYSLSGTMRVGETVPEPSSWALVLTCSAWLGLVRRRQAGSGPARR